jgi:hypothetical protein
MEDENSLSEQLSGDMEDVENGGVGVGDAEEDGNETSEEGLIQDDDPHGIKKRLGMQAKKHQREMRRMQDRLSQLESMQSQDSATPPGDYYNTNPYPYERPYSLPLERRNTKRGRHEKLNAKHMCISNTSVCMMSLIRLPKSMTISMRWYGRKMFRLRHMCGTHFFLSKTQPM